MEFRDKQEEKAYWEFTRQNTADLFHQLEKAERQKARKKSLAVWGGLAVVAAASVAIGFLIDLLG